jgi:hypothetical protein
MIASLVRFFGSESNVIAICCDDSVKLMFLAGILNSLPFDYFLRIRFSGLALDYHVTKEIPTPTPLALAPAQEYLVSTVLRLNCGHPLFSPEWLLLCKERNESWRYRWAITDHERLRLRCSLDAVVACLYGLNTDHFAWIMRDCDHPHEVINSKDFMRTLDPKGFWRVDKSQPPELRSTVLAQIAFHDLQRIGLEAFMAQNNGEGWMLPETLRLSDYGLGHDDRARQLQPVASQFGDRFLPWQLNEDVEQSWKECHRHAESIRAIRSRFAPGPAAAVEAPNPATRQPPFTPPAVDLLGQPIPTDLFGNELPPPRRRR